MTAAGAGGAAPPLALAGGTRWPTMSVRRLGGVWLAALIAAVFVTPVLRLPGGVPLRLDDALAFGGLAVFLLAKLRQGVIPRPTAVGATMLVTMAYILLVTARGSPLAGFGVGPREYLDALRPLKFLAVVLLVSRLDPTVALDTLRRVLLPLVVALLVFGLAQLFLLTADSAGPLARASLLFTELEEWHARVLFGLRPFSTFHTPTDFGYAMSVTMLAALLLRPLAHWRVIALASLLGVVISGTRTFLFFLPVLLLAHAALGGRDLKSTLKLMLGVVLLVAAGVGLTAKLMGGFLASIQLTIVSLATRDLAADQSIIERLENLRLVELTLREAPWTGVVTRGLFTRGVDSDYILTLHRYGLLGIGCTLLFYGVAVADLLRHRRRDGALGRLALLVVVLTFVYGITQASLGSTRVGTLPFVLIGLVYAARRAPAPPAADAPPTAAPAATA